MQRRRLKEGGVDLARAQKDHAMHAFKKSNRIKLAPVSCGLIVGVPFVTVFRFLVVHKVVLLSSKVSPHSSCLIDTCFEIS